MSAVLLVGAEGAERDASAKTLRAAGYEVETADDSRLVVAVLRRRSDIAAVVLDQQVESCGIDLVPGLRERRPDMVIVLVADKLDDAMAAALLRLDVNAVLGRPFDATHLARAVTRMVNRRISAHMAASA